MAFYLEISEPFLEKLDKQRIQQAVEFSLKSEELLEPVGLSVIISGDAQVQELNRQFRNINAPTDVLSFPAEELDPQSGERYIGDVIISYQRAEANCLSDSEDAGPTQDRIQDEVLLLTVHGVLHLLGFDHQSKEDKAVMWAKQKAVLNQLGVSPTVIEQL